MTFGLSDSLMDISFRDCDRNLYPFALSTFPLRDRRRDRAAQAPRPSPGVGNPEHSIVGAHSFANLEKDIKVFKFPPLIFTMNNAPYTLRVTFSVFSSVLNKTFLNVELHRSMDDVRLRALALGWQIAKIEPLS